MWGDDEEVGWFLDDKSQCYDEGLLVEVVGDVVEVMLFCRGRQEA